MPIHRVSVLMAAALARHTSIADTVENQEQWGQFLKRLEGMREKENGGSPWKHVPTCPAGGLGKLEAPWQSSVCAVHLDRTQKLNVRPKRR